MESKEEKNPSEFVGFDLLPELIFFCESPEFTEKLENFYDENVGEFLDVCECKNPGEDQRHEYFESFQKYEALLEGLITSFAQDNGSSPSALFKNCRDVVDGKFTPLFVEHESLWFVELMTSWSNYSNFFEHMCKRAEKELRKGRK